jgi:hypothetical protein
MDTGVSWGVVAVDDGEAGTGALRMRRSSAGSPVWVEERE